MDVPLAPKFCPFIPSKSLNRHYLNSNNRKCAHACLQYDDGPAPCYQMTNSCLPKAGQHSRYARWANYITQSTGDGRNCYAFKSNTSTFGCSSGQGLPVPTHARIISAFFRGCRLHCYSVAHYTVWPKIAGPLMSRGQQVNAELLTFSLPQVSRWVGVQGEVVLHARPHAEQGNEGTVCSPRTRSLGPIAAPQQIT